MALKILLADDSMTAQNMGKKILSDAGYEVLTVSNGAAAVKKLAEVTPDIAVLDVYMPGYSGLEVCERMKVMPATARVPVLLTVGKMEPFRPEDGMKAKADGVIIKPFEATDLVTVVGKLAQRTYGVVPTAGESQPQPIAEQHVARVAQPAPAQVLSSADEEESEPVQRCVVDEDSEPVFSAAGLETFEATEEVATVAREPQIEFTAAPQVEVAAERIAGLEPTVLQDVISAETATEDTLVSFGGVAQPAAGKLPGLGEGALQAYSALTGRADGPGAEPVWEAVAEPTDLDAVDLEAEMQKAQGQSQAAVTEDFAAVLAPVEEDFEPRTMAAGVAMGTPVQAREPGVPLLAPIGKTSLDEFDSIMAETASKFEASSASAVDVQENLAPQVGAAQDSDPLAQIPTIPEEATDFELEPSREEMADSAVAATDSVARDEAFQPTAEQQDAGVSALLAELIAEEREEPVFTPMPATMRGSDALSGVFEVEEPKAAEEALPEVEAVQGPTEPELAVAAEEEEPVWATIVPERVSKDLLLHATEGPADNAADTQAANGVHAEPAPVEVTRPAISLDEASMNTLVERVVDRVLERLKPILVVTVEEILREFKR